MFVTYVRSRLALIFMSQVSFVYIFGNKGYNGGQTLHWVIHDPLRTRGGVLHHCFEVMVFSRNFFCEKGSVPPRPLLRLGNMTWSILTRLPTFNATKNCVTFIITTRGPFGTIFNGRGFVLHYHRLQIVTICVSQGQMCGICFFFTF